MTLMLGIDTGGTYTDAVVLDRGAGVDAAAGSVVATAKVPTTHGDLAVGVAGAMAAVTASSAVDVASIGLVSLATTLATNALVEGHGEPACLVLAGLGRERFDGRIEGLSIGDDDVIEMVAGGHDALGVELTPLDLDELLALADRTAARVSGYAVATLFSVRNPDHELRIAAALTAATGHPVTCSHELSSRLDGPRRALTSLLNARLIALIASLESATRAAMRMAGIDAPLMVVRGDGSLVSTDFVLRRPIETIRSGPAASVIGAQHLAGIQDGLVVDIGGTTTDIAAVCSGQPVLASTGADSAVTADNGVEVAGHPTLVDAIGLATHGLGGDSEVRAGGHGAGFTLGPGRAIPLARFAVEHPEIVEILENQRHRSGSTRGQGRLVVDLAGDNDVVAELDAAPTSVTLANLVRRHRRGLVELATVTPTDAAVVLGRHDAETEHGFEAARLGLELLARRSDGRGKPLADSAEAMALLIDRALIDQSADRVLESGLRADGLEGVGAAQSVIRAGLDGSTGEPTRGRFVSISVSLGAPIVAVGAAANTYYGAVAAALGTDVVVPRHAAVAGAIGAVVGRVRVERMVTITRPSAGRFVMHGGDRASFTSVEEARVAAEVQLDGEVRALADQAGAAEVAVTFAWKANTATVEGKELLVEATLIAIATGRPRSGPAGGSDACVAS